MLTTKNQIHLTATRAKVVSYFWLFCLLAASISIVLLNQKPEEVHQIPTWMVACCLFGLSAFCEYVDSSLGMGYGTTLTPILLTFGVIRQDLVPAILLSELLTGVFSALAHHKVGNVNLIKDKSFGLPLVLLVVPSVIGVVLAVVLSNEARTIGKHYANLYVGVMITLIGIYLIYSRYFKKTGPGKISKTKLIILGTVAAFNKGVSGGGYGPLMTGGQLASGIREKEAIVVTSICEAFTCFAGLVVFFLLGYKLNLYYAIPLCMGSMLTVIPAAKTVKILPKGLLKQSIGWATLLLGLLTLWKFLH